MSLSRSPLPETHTMSHPRQSQVNMLQTTLQCTMTNDPAVRVPGPGFKILERSGRGFAAQCKIYTLHFESVGGFQAHVPGSEAGLC